MHILAYLLLVACAVYNNVAIFFPAKKDFGDKNNVLIDNDSRTQGCMTTEVA